MDEEILRKLDELVKMGKLTEEEKNEMLKEILSEGDDESSMDALKGKYKRISINIERQDLEIEGSDIDNVQIEEGMDTVNIEEKDDELKIMSKLKVKLLPHFNFNRLISTIPALKIKVPKEIDINIHTISGDVKVKGIKGKLSLKSLSGDTEIEEFEGGIELDSASGDLRLIRVKGDVNFHLKSGDVNIRECEIEGSLKTYSGDVHIEKSLIKGLEFNIFSGDIKMRDALIEGDVKGKSHHGDVDLSINSDNLSISLKTKRGDVKILKDGVREKISDEKIIIGEGRNKIDLVSLSGDVKVSVKTHG
ncbi:MAG: hypothetical protein DRI28_01980 [Caldiserica bacterium]|nr:MAG: hypothetical protein DRI28_01980 [Caldisericota bacterium]